MNTQVFFNTTTKILVASLLVATVLLVATKASSKRHLREGAGRSLQWGAMFEWVEETVFADTATEQSFAESLVVVEDHKTPIFEVGGAALGGADSNHLRAPGTASGSDLLEGGTTPIDERRPLVGGELPENSRAITIEKLKTGSVSIVIEDETPTDEWGRPIYASGPLDAKELAEIFGEPGSKEISSTILGAGAGLAIIQKKTFDEDAYKGRASSNAHGGHIYDAMEDHHHRHRYSVPDDNDINDATATAAADSSGSSGSDGSN